MRTLIISFDIDGTLGKQKSQIKDINKESMEYAQTVEIKGDKFGDFVFYKGIINLLTKLNELGVKIILNTAGFKTPGCETDRNEQIRNYISDCLSTNIPLYDIRYQTFNRVDIVLAKQGKIKSKGWQDWFNGLFKMYKINDLHTVDEEGFKAYYYRDHQVILDKHPELYDNVKQNDILHVDDSPETVFTFHPSDKVHLIQVDRDHIDKNKETVELYSKIEKWIFDNK